MEILHRGTPPSEREYKASCYNCRTVVKFKQSEGKITHDQRDGSYVSVSCPVCAGNINISTSQYIKPPSVDPY